VRVAVDILAIGSVLAGLTCAGGQARGQESPEERGTPAPPSAHAIQSLAGDQILAKRLIDAEVFAPDGRAVGEVEDIILQHGQGRVIAIVVELDLPRGRRDRYIALPLDRLSLASDGTSLQVELSPEQADALPRFDYRR
jgi:sporulation protein YlmC with PRC-barrel domain